MRKNMKNKMYPKKANKNTKIEDAKIASYIDETIAENQSVQLKETNKSETYYNRTDLPSICSIKKINIVLKYTKNIIISLFLSLSVSAILIFMIYKLLPDSSYISLVASPKTYNIEEFSGGMAAKVQLFEVKYGTLINYDEILVSVDNQTFLLKPYELVVTFNQDKDIDKYGVPYANSLLFDSQVDVYTNYSDGFNFIDTQVSIEKMPKLIGKMPSRMSSDEKGSSVTLKTAVPNKLFISVLKGSEITVNGGVDVLVKGKKMPLNSQITVLETRDQEIINSHFILNSNEFKIHGYQDDYIYLEGLIKSFNGVSDQNGVLKHTYLNQQKEYDVGTLEVDGNYDDILLEFEYELGEYNSSLILSGPVKSINVAHASLYFSFFQFLVENLGTVISAVFTAFIITYVPYIFAKKDS